MTKKSTTIDSFRPHQGIILFNKMKRFINDRFNEAIVSVPIRGLFYLTPLGNKLEY